MDGATAPRKTRRPSDILLALLGVRLFLWFTVATSAAPGLLATPYTLASYHDEHFWFAHEDAARISLVGYHQLPAWNPFYCGGVPGIANPQDSTWGPSTLLKLAFGLEPGRRLACIVLFVLGMEGLYRLARRHDASTIGAALAAIVFAFSSFYLDMVRLGWLNFFSFQLLPWVLLAYYEGLRSIRWRVFGGMFIAWMLLEGGLYTVPYTVLVLSFVVLASTATLLTKRGRSPLPLHVPALTFVTIGIVAVLISAAKLFPTMVVVRGLPRIWQASEALPWNDILARLLRPGQHDGQPAYIGATMFALALLGAGFDRRAAGFVGFAVLFLLIALGDFAPYAPHALVHRLPVFEQLRFPHRFVIVIAFFLCLAAARTVTRLEDVSVAGGRVLWDRLTFPARPALPLLAVAALGVVGAFGSYKAARFIYDDFIKDSRIDVGMFPMDPPLAYDVPFHQSRGNRWDAQVWARASLGSIQCFEETAFPQSGKLRGDLVDEEYPLDPALAKVKRVRWTPNAIDLHVEASAATTVLINQNWARGFRTNVGTVRSHDGLLAIDVPAGVHELTVRYRDPMIFVGLVTSLGTAIGLLVHGAWAWRRGRSVTSDADRAGPTSP